MELGSLKILALSDAGCTTGFGRVAHELYSRWVGAGHEVHVIAINYLGDPWESDYKLYPAAKYNQQDVYGTARVVEMLHKIKPDILFMLNDLPVLSDILFNNPYDVEKQALRHKVVMYAPVDSDGLPPKFLMPTSAGTVVAMSKWGADQLSEATGKDIQHIHHGVSHDKFYRADSLHPIQVELRGKHTITSKKQAKKFLGWGDKFVIIDINRNSPRKNHYDTFKIFAEFSKKVPEAILYAHTKIKDVGGDLFHLTERLGITNKVIFPKDLDTFVGLPDHMINLLYNASDVKLSTSYGEGFGLTDAEALACGVPVIAQDFSATTEVVGDGGILIKPVGKWSTSLMTDLAVPDNDEFVKQLFYLYENGKVRGELGNKGIKHASHFQWDKVANDFLDVFKGVLA